MTRALVLVSDFTFSVRMRCLMGYGGFNVTVAASPELARTLLEQIDFKLILVDTREEKEKLINFFKDLRGKGLYTPVIYFTSAREHEYVQKNCSGLDDIIPMPFNYHQLKDKMQKSLLKAHSQRKPLIYSSIEIDERNRLLTYGNEMIRLGALEMKILLLLCKKSGQVVSLDRFHTLLENEGQRLTTIFYHISCLRKKLQDAGINTLQLNFVKEGYRLDLA